MISKIMYNLYSNPQYPENSKDNIKRGYENNHYRIHLAGNALITTLFLSLILTYIVLLPVNALSNDLANYNSSLNAQDVTFEEYDTDEDTDEVSDPLEGFNRAMFTFNDRLYFWVIKPVAKSYSSIVPHVIRKGINNFFHNLNYPMRLLGSILQLKTQKAAMETFKFFTNTVFGLGGLIDYSFEFDEFNIDGEDTGQALAYYGMGNGAYIIWPFLGPMTFRDTIGFCFDYALQPVSYVTPLYMSFGVRSFDVINKTSLELGDYEALKEGSLDPYIAFKDAYIQYRNSRIKR